MKLSPITPSASLAARPSASQAVPLPLGALPLSAAHLLIHAEMGRAQRPGGSVLEAALHGLRVRTIGSPGRASSIPLQLQVADLQGRCLHAIADAGRLTDLPLPAGTYQVAAQLGGRRRSYTMSLEPGTFFHLHLRFGLAGH
jgi:hypothetical protein